MKKKLIGILVLCFVLCLPFLAVVLRCKTNHNLRKYTRSILTMGTYAEVTIYGQNKKSTEKVFEKVFDAFRAVDKKMSIYKKDSELSRVNREAYKQSIEISDELAYVLKKSIYFSKLSKGDFDVTVAPLMELWGFIQKRKTLPPLAERRRVIEKIGYEKIVLQQNKIRFAVNGTQIDLGGIAKGYAVDKGVEILKRAGIRNALINLGGNIYALGTPPEKNYWTVGIKNPLQKEKILGTIRLKNQAVATSGSYERFVQIENKTYSHIINPHTGIPVKGVLSVTVIAKSAIETDALSTAFFVMGVHRTFALAKKFKNINFLFVLPDKISGYKIVKYGVH